MRFHEDLWDGGSGFDEGVMSSIILPIFFPETVDFPHFLLGIVDFLFLKLFSYFFLEPVCLDKVLCFSDFLAISEVLVMLFFHIK